MTDEALRRRETWLVNLNPGRGSEQAGMRTTLLIHNDVGNRYAATTMVAAITAARKNYRVTVFLNTHESGLDRPSMVNLAWILTLDKSRLLRIQGAIPEALLREVDAALMISFGIRS